MKKIFRYLVIGVVAAIVFLVASIAIFIAVFDANAYKDDLSELVRQHTGRELEFHGDVEVTVYPALGMKLGAMSFSNREGFGARPMIKVKEASISVDMASLITLAPEVDKLVLRDLEVNLVTNKAGETNWGDLVQPETQAAGGGAAGDSSGSASAAKPDFEIRGAFGGLDLQNIRLLWLDEQAGTKLEIVDLDLSTGRIEPNRPFPLALSLETQGDVTVQVDYKSNVDFNIDQQRLKLDAIELALNQYRVTGSLQLADFANPAPSLRFDLATQDIDVDALLGTPPAEAAGSEAAQQQAADAPDEDVQIPLPTQTLRDLDIDGKLSISQIKLQNLRMQDVAITVKAEDGVVGLKPVTLKAYGGKVETSVVVDVRDDTPRYGIDNSVQAIRVGKALEDYAGKAQISGNLGAEANLTTSGEWLSELKKNLNGTLKLEFLDGAINGFNIRHSIDTAKAKLKGAQPPSRDTLKTDFSSLTLSGKIRNGVFSSDDLDLRAPLVRVGGKGSADLRRETVDYIVNAKLVGSVEGQQGETADQLAGLEIPVSIKGPFVDPKIDVLLDEILKARAAAEKAKLKAEIEAQKKALEAEIEAKKKELEARQEAKLEKKQRELKQKLEAEKEKRKQELLEKLTN